MIAPPSKPQSHRDPVDLESSNANVRQQTALTKPFETGDSTKPRNDKRYNSGLHFSATQPNNLELPLPCYFLKLPAELRQEVFRYLMPEEPIQSMIVYHTNWSAGRGTIVTGGALRTSLPVLLHSIFLGFGRDTYQEIKDVFYSMTTFTIDITRDGVMLCE